MRNGPWVRIQRLYIAPTPERRKANRLPETPSNLSNDEGKKLEARHLSWSVKYYCNSYSPVGAEWKAMIRE